MMKHFCGKKHILFIIFLLFYFSLIAYKLVNHPTPFYDWDESIYIQVGKEMVQNRRIIPTWQGQPWFEKPPLVPLIYGLITVYLPSPEVSTRMVNLFISLFALTLVYVWSLKISKQVPIALLTVVLTAWDPIFIQRSQVVNTDVFLLIGWLGYFLYASRFWPGFVFLFLGVMSKSLLGFYPAIIFFMFELFRFFKYKKTRQSSLHALKIVFVQCLTLFSYYAIMIALYRASFINVHFTDHLLRRITSSIESHFGKRTFYFDVIIEQYSIFLLLSLLSIFLIVKQWVRKNISDRYLLLSFAFLPFFFFLNVTKTKIAWYLYPVIPQVAFLLSYPLSLVSSRKNILYFLAIACMGYVSYQWLIPNQFFKSYYSQYNEYHAIIAVAKQQCSKLLILVDPTDRKTHDTLSSMNLLISTSEWYSSRPSLVYYFGKPISFFYSVDGLRVKKNTLALSTCILMDKQDEQEVGFDVSFALISHKKDLLLFKKKQ